MTDTTVRALTPELVADGFRFLEGPRWHDGQLYASDMYDRVVFTVAADGSTTTVAAVPNEPSGLGWTPAGDLLAVSMLDRQLLRLRDGALTPYADLSGHFGYEANDMLVDAAGRAWVGSFGFTLAPGEKALTTSLLRVDPDGTVTAAAGDLHFPNGVAITPDGATLLVAETFAYRVTAFDVAADGSLSGRRVWADFADGPSDAFDEWVGKDCVHPDGIALDAAGGLWVADAKGAGAVRVLPGGEITDQVVLDGLTAFSVVLGGDDGHTLFLAAAPPIGTTDWRAARTSSIWQVRVEHPVAPAGPVQ
jgi:sugar lactone lactonase YvrE